MLGMVERRLRWSLSDIMEPVDCVGVMVKKELCKKRVDVRSVCDSIMANVMVLQDVHKLICGYTLLMEAVWVKKIVYMS